MPKVSVIMPAYNTPREFLSEAIESVINQTFKDFELLIIDDCSDSYVKETILSYKQRDNRIQYFRIDKNSGAAVARNLGLKHARGQYIAFLDSDDVSLPQRFEKQLDFFNQHPDISCLGTVHIKIPENKICQDPIEHQDIVTHLLIKGCALCQSSVMLKKELLTSNNIEYDSRYIPAEDYALWLDLIGYAKFHNMTEPLTKYRLHESNISKTQVTLQMLRSNQARIKKLSTCINMDDCTQNLLLKTYFPEDMTIEELNTLEKILPQITKELTDKNFELPMVLRCFSTTLKRIMRKAKNPKVTRAACLSPLNNFLNVGMLFRIYSFVRRGIF